MVICLCSTRNMYAQLQTMIIMLQRTQPSLERIYAFVEDDVPAPPESKVTFINVGDYIPLKENMANNGNHWSYMSMCRCYFFDLLPHEPKVIYMDLDIMIERDISELWNMDLQGHEIAGVVDAKVWMFGYHYIKHPTEYINSGCIVMDLDLIRKNGTGWKMHDMLSTWPLKMPDQDAINLNCSILHIDCKWNSSDATTISPDPMINHVIRVKPWDPNSRWFPKWVQMYSETGGKLCIAPY